MEKELNEYEATLGLDDGTSVASLVVIKWRTRTQKRTG